MSSFGSSEEVSQLYIELERHLEEDSTCWEEGISLGIYLLRHSSPGTPVRERRKAEKCVLTSLRLRTMDPGSYVADAWACVDCWGVLREPVTLKCGHTVCKACLTPSCPKCGAFCGRDTHDSPNVLINDLVHKYWDPELRAVDCKREGNALFQDGNILEALQAYSEAVKLSPIDPSIRNNRSNAYFKLNEFEEALKEAEVAIRLRPNWTKAYYRRSAALRALGREDEAFKTLYQCLILDKDPSVLIQNELCSLISGMKLSYIEDKDEKTLKILERFPALKAKQKESKKVLQLIKEASQSMEKFLRGVVCPRRLPVDKNVVDVGDYECSLCLRLFWEPVTTPCGHTFCKSCLDRFLDHKPLCALCKFDLADFLANRNGASCEFIQESLKRLLPDAYEERKSLHEQETRDLIGKETPIFVCTMSFPSIPCPLHVYEPRYRLMIRRCMETGTREFGMCPPGTTSIPYADYGTMLEVKNIKYFPDGRSIVNTVGGRRFRVLSRSSRDGYSVANVEFLIDDAISEENGELLQEIKELHDSALKLTCSWFQSMKSQLQEEIVSHFGSMPDQEPNYWKLNSGPSWIWWALAILPLDQKTQVKILSQTSLKNRLKSIKTILIFLSRKSSSAFPSSSASSSS